MAGDEIGHRLPRALVGEMRELELFLRASSSGTRWPMVPGPGEDVADGVALGRRDRLLERFHAEEGCTTMTLGGPPR